MDVSPGRSETAPDTPPHRPLAAADQGPTPAFVRPRPLWEAADEAAAGQSAAAPAAPGKSLPSKGGLSRFAPNMPNACHDGRSAEDQDWGSQGHAQTLAQSHQGLLSQDGKASGSGGSAGATTLGAGQGSAASEASAAAAAASTAAQVSDVHIWGTAATLERLAVNAAYDGRRNIAPDCTAATVASSATSSASALFHGRTAQNTRAAGVEESVKQAVPKTAPDLETAFRQSLRVGPQPPQAPGGDEQGGWSLPSIAARAVFWYTQCCC